MTHHRYTANWPPPPAGGPLLPFPFPCAGAQERRHPITNATETAPTKTPSQVLRGIPNAAAAAPVYKGLAVGTETRVTLLASVGPALLNAGPAV